MCFDKRVIAGIVVVGAAVAVFAPGALAVALPVLVLAACPLSMLFMMRAVSGPPRSSTPANRDEVAELRAEVARLRAANPHRTGRSDDAVSEGR